MQDESPIKQIFQSFEKRFNEQLAKKNLHLSKLQYALEEALKYALNRSKDVNASKQYIADQYDYCIKQFLILAEKILSLAELLSTYEFFSDAQRLQSVFSYIPDSPEETSFLLTPWRKQKIKAPFLLKREACDWPKQTAPYPDETPSEIIDEVLKKILAQPAKVPLYAESIGLLLKLQLKKNPKLLLNDYAFQVIAYLHKPDAAVFMFIMRLVSSLWEESKSPVDIQRLYPIKMLELFADNTHLLDGSHSIPILLQDCILRDTPNSFQSLIASVNTIKAADFVLAQLKLHKAFHLDPQKLLIFIRHDLLMSRLILQLNNKQSLEFFDSLKGSLGELDIPTTRSILIECSQEFGVFALKDTSLFKQLSENNETRVICIQRNFIEKISLQWLKDSTFSLDDAETILLTFSALPESSALLAPAIQHFKKALHSAWQENPSKRVEVSKAIRALLSTVNQKHRTEVLNALSDFLMNQSKLLEIILEEPGTFLLSADVLLSYDSLRYHLIAELVEFEQKNYIHSDLFQRWFELPPQTLTKLILSSENISKAIAARNDFTKKVISKIRHVPLAEILIKESKLTLDDLTQILSDPDLNPKVAQAALKKVKSLDFANLSEPQLALFLTTICKVNKKVKLGEITLAEDLKDHLHYLFSNKELQSTYWMQVFAEYYATHPDAIAHLSFDEFQWSHILLAQMKLTPTKPLAHNINLSIAQWILNNQEINDQQYVLAIQHIVKSPEFKTAWLTNLLMFSCNSLQRAKIICQSTETAAEVIYKNIIAFSDADSPATQIENKKRAYFNLIFGTLLAHRSMQTLQTIPNVLNYLLQTKTDQIETKELLTILKRSQVGLGFPDVASFLKKHKELSISDFELIPYRFSALDYLFIVAGIPTLNEDLRIYLLEKYCQAAPRLYAKEIHHDVVTHLTSHFSKQTIETVLAKIFQTKYLNQENLKKDFVIIPIEEYNELCDTNLLYPAQHYSQGYNGLFALTAHSAIVFGGWYRDSILSKQNTDMYIRKQLQDGNVVVEPTPQDTTQYSRSLHALDH